jgi:hypothetical protein
MSDFMIVDPADFSVDQLKQAARGRLPTLKAQLAVTLLHAKLGDRAEPHLVDIATDDSVDPTARHTATLALGSFPSARETLATLAESDVPLVADAAAQALNQ